MRWLVSFWAFVVCYERLGPAGPALFALGLSLAGPAATSVVKHASFATGRSSIPSGGRVLTAGVLKHLNTIVAIGLIVGMIIGAIVGGIFFSYKIGVEGKDAVMSLKSHVQKSNYAERIGFKKWMDDNDLPALLDQYSTKLCDTVWQQIDDLAVQYNLTDFANGFRHFLLGRSARPSNETWTGLTRSPPHPYNVKLQALSMRVKNHEWAMIYRELDSIFRELLITREDLVVKAKDLALQGIEVSKRVLLSSTSVLGGSANLMFSIGLKFVSGAAELLNFVSQLMVFLWVLFYLITLESGGATEQAVGMIPISKSMRVRCVEVINKQCTFGHCKDCHLPWLPYLAAIQDLLGPFFVHIDHPRIHQCLSPSIPTVAFINSCCDSAINRRKIHMGCRIGSNPSYADRLWHFSGSGGYTRA
ncbi:unnamed protein product [Musa textilis]